MKPELNYRDKAARWRDGESANTWGRIIRYDKNQNRLIREIMGRISGNCRRVLDLWSWDGRVSGMLPEEIEYTWVDFSRLVDDCSVHCEQLALKRKFFKHDLTEWIPTWVGRDFDLILALYVLHFFTPAWIEKLLSEARGLLSSKGAIVYVWYDNDPKTERLSRRVMEQLGLVVYDIGEFDSSRYVWHIGRIK